VGAASAAQNAVESRAVESRVDLTVAKASDGMGAVAGAEASK
jgi:hypothetical protein